MGSSSPTPVQTTQKTDTSPWGPQQPHLQNVFGEAERLYNDPNNPTFYPGQTFAGPSQSTLQGLAGTEARALQGSPVLGAAQNEATKTLSGDYLNAGNPHFDQMAGRIRAQVTPAISANFGNAGGTGGLQTRAASMGLGDAIGSLAYQNYGDERNRMMGAMGQAPGLAAADYLDPQMLLGAGAQREQIAQQPISEAMARHNFETNLPQAKLADYLQMIQGSFGGVSNTTGTQYLPPQSPWGGILGGIMSGAGILGGTGAFGPAGWLKF
jgi:hypothetical protein